MPCMHSSVVPFIITMAFFCVPSIIVLILSFLAIIIISTPLCACTSAGANADVQQWHQKQWHWSVPIPLGMDAMLTAGRHVYDKQATPTQNNGIATNVKLAMYIEGIGSFRTHTMDFQLDVYLQQFWKDPRLAHNESSRILIRDKSILQRIWHPDVYFANARIAQFHEVTQPNFLLWIERDGSILYDTRVSMIVICAMNLKNFPLDSQWCHLRILSYAYDINQLQIEWIQQEPITKNMNITMSDMDIVKLVPGICDGNYSTGEWSCVTAEFFVSRELTHHILQTYVPTTLIVVISWFSFWLDVEAVPARVSLAITTLLTLSTQANSVKNSLPEVSYMKSLDLFLAVSVLFVFGVLIEFTIVNYTQRNATMAAAGLLVEENEEKSPAIARQLNCMLGCLQSAFVQHRHKSAQKCTADDHGNCAQFGWFLRKLGIVRNNNNKGHSRNPKREKGGNCCAVVTAAMDIEANNAAITGQNEDTNIGWKGGCRGGGRILVGMERRCSASSCAAAAYDNQCCCSPQIQHVLINNASGNNSSLSCRRRPSCAPLIVYDDEDEIGGEGAKECHHQQKPMANAVVVVSVDQREAARLASWSKPEMSICEGLAAALQIGGTTKQGMPDGSKIVSKTPPTIVEPGNSRQNEDELHGLLPSSSQSPLPSLLSQPERCSPIHAPIKRATSFISSSQDQLLDCGRRRQGTTAMSASKSNLSMLLGWPLDGSARLSTRRASVMASLLDPINIGTNNNCSSNSRRDSMASSVECGEGGNAAAVCGGGSMAQTMPVQAKWRHAVRKLQMNKREAGRMQAKKIDAWSRWMFPLTYLSFQAAYWYYYLKLAV